MPYSLGLFLAGVLCCQFIVLPKAIHALLWFNRWLGLEPDLRLTEWLSFAILMPVFFGIAFQTPLIMMLLERIGVVTLETYRSKRRGAYFVLAVVACFTPSFDAFSMVFMWLALVGLYELGIRLCVWAPKRPDFGVDVPEPEDMVEV